MLQELLRPEVRKFIKDHQHDDPFLLSLKAKKSPGFPWKEAIEQIQSLQKAKKKLPCWYQIEKIIWPPPVSVEQSSSELTARFKPEIIPTKSMADLTGGMGVDTAFFAEKASKIHYVEAREDLAAIAKHNFKVLGKTNITVHNQSAEAFLAGNKKRFDAIFLDPSRRRKERKVFRIEDCTPNLYEIIPKCLEFTDHVLAKLSPMVDMSLLIKDFSPSRIWAVSVSNEIKEVLCLIKPQKSMTRIAAVELENDGGKVVFEFDADEEAAAQSEYSMPLRYLYEPSASLLKTGAFKLIGQRFGLKKLHRHSHLYTSEEKAPNFHGRTYLLKDQLKADKKTIAKYTPDKKINVVTRNYPLSADQLKKKFGLKDGGEDFLIGTTQVDGKKALLFCEKI